METLVPTAARLCDAEGTREGAGLNTEEEL